MRLHRPTFLTATAFFLIACQASFAATPTIAVMPGPGKTLEQFQNDDAACLAFANNQTYSTAQAAQGAGSGTALRGTARGAAAGALFGAAGGDAGKGAAIGAGVGLVGGSVRKNRQANQAAQSVQQSYNIAYAQCMKTKNNAVPSGAYQ